MEYRKLGRTGLKVSELCMGTMQFGWTADEEPLIQILTAALRSRDQFRRYRRYLFPLGRGQPWRRF